MLLAYTYIVERKGGPPITTTIDHFLITPNLTDKVVSYESDTIYNNISDHIPLILKLKIDGFFSRGVV